MVEKKATTKTAAKKPAAKKAPVAKKAPAAKKDVLYLNAENAGFRAGDVYQALAASEKALTVAEIAKAGTILRRGDSFLHLAHFRSQCRLVSHC